MAGLRITRWLSVSWAKEREREWHGVAVAVAVAVAVEVEVVVNVEKGVIWVAPSQSVAVVAGIPGCLVHCTIIHTYIPV